MEDALNGYLEAYQGCVMTQPVANQNAGRGLSVFATASATQALRHSVSRWEWVPVVWVLYRRPG